MKIKGNITFLIRKDDEFSGRNGSTLELRCTSSRVKFLEIKLNNEQVMSLFQGIAEIPCEMNVSNLDAVGKTKETVPVTFQINTKHIKYNSAGDSYIEKEIMDLHCPEGYEMNYYIGSKDAKQYMGDDLVLIKTYAYRYVGSEK